jgi:predicted nicotinamide N-methyase
MANNEEVEPEYFTKQCMFPGEEEEEVSIRLCSKRPLDHYATNVNLTGHAIWFAGNNMCDMIASDPSLFSCRNLLELGSGTGVGGIFCAAVVARFQQRILSHDNDPLQAEEPSVGKQTFLLTDGFEDVVTNLRHNIELNHDLFVGAQQSPDVFCEQLQWGDETTMSKILDTHTEGQLFDVILGADLLYSAETEQDIKCLFSTVKYLLARSPSARFYLSYTRRKLDISKAIAIAETFDLESAVHPMFTYDLFDNNTEEQTAFWRDSIYVFRHSSKSLGISRSKNDAIFDHVADDVF